VRPLLGIKEARSELSYRNYGASAPRLKTNGFGNRLSHISSHKRNQESGGGEPVASDRPISSPGILYFPTVDDFWSIYEHITNIAYEDIAEEQQPLTISLNPATSYFVSSVSSEAHRIADHYDFDLVYIFRFSPEMLRDNTREDTVVTEAYVIYSRFSVDTLHFPYRMYETVVENRGWTKHKTDSLPPKYSCGYSRSFVSEGPTRASAPSLIFTCLQGLAKNPEEVDVACLYHDAETIMDIAKAYLK
jgi:hypothetical protein